MFAGFKPLKPILHVESGRFTDEQRYWSRLKEVSVFQENGNITSTEFMPVSPHHVATTFGNSVVLYETNNCHPIAHYTKMKSPLQCSSFRPDGQIIALGAQDGTVRVMRYAAGKTIFKCSVHPIQNFPKAHKTSVNCLAFAPPTGVNFASLADDGAVRLWDLSDSRGIKAEPLWSADDGHADQARSAMFANRNFNILITGAYDHKVKLWDVRDGGYAPKLEIDHGCPVEKVLLFPNETIIASAGGTTIKLWDIVAGGKLLHTMENHFKAVTSMCFATNQTYLLSGGLDRRINLFRCNSGDFALVKSWKVAAPVLSLSMSSDDSRMAFGMSNLLSIYRRKSEKEANDAPNGVITGGVTPSGMLNGHAEPLKRKRQRSQSTPLVIDPNIIDQPTRRVAAPPVVQRLRDVDGNAPKSIVVELSARYENQLKIGQIDRMLRDRRFREFFATAIARCAINENRTEFAVAALQQLRIRQKVALALSGHPETVLRQFVRFLELNLFKAPFFDVLYDVFDVFLKIYSEKTLSLSVIRAINKLKRAISTEIEMQRELAKCIGAISMICHRPASNALRNAATLASTSSELTDNVEEREKEIASEPMDDDSGVTAGDDDTTDDTVDTVMKLPVDLQTTTSTQDHVIVVDAERAKQTVNTVLWVF